MTSIIPYARAPGLRRDGRILNEEDAARRAREAPARDNWCLAPLPPGTAIGDRSALTANLIRFFYLGQIASMTTIAQARCTITTSSAGQNVRAAIFGYDKSQERGRRLIKLADSEVKFLADSTGLQIVATPTFPEVSGGQFFMAVKASDNTLGVGGSAAVAFSRTVPVYTYQDGAGSMPGLIDFGGLTKSYTTAILDVAYVNPDAAQVL